MRIVGARENSITPILGAQLLRKYLAASTGAFNAHAASVKIIVHRAPKWFKSFRFRI